MWSVTHILPARLRRAGFELTEDVDFLVLWHEHVWVARFLGMATNMPYIIDAARDHLLQDHAAEVREAVEV